MTITQLEYVLAVAKEKHFGKAAENCHVTQPTLSMQLQKLEEELEVIIFDRSKTPIEITDEGKVIIGQAKKIINEHYKLYSMLEESKDEVRGEFTLAIIPTLSSFLIPLFLKDFSEKYPKVNLTIKESITEDIIEDLNSGIIDAGLLVTPLNEKNIQERKLYYEPFYLFSARNHELYNKDMINEDELNLKDIWLLNKGNCFRDQVLNICKSIKDDDIDKQVQFESGSFETLKKLVLSGYGYTILPHMAVKELPDHQKDMVKNFAAPVPTREVSLVHAKYCVKHKVLNALEEEILAIVPDDIRQIYNDKQAIIDIT